jgi:tRNA1(Val) A37 N6-methylase TrmN6
METVGFLVRWPRVTTFADLGTSMGRVAVIAQRFRACSAVEFVDDMAELTLESVAVAGVEG